MLCFVSSLWSFKVLIFFNDTVKHQNPKRLIWTSVQFWRVKFAMSRQEHAECSFMLTVICYIQFLMLFKREGTVEMIFFKNLKIFYMQ